MEKGLNIYFNKKNLKEIRELLSEYYDGGISGARYLELELRAMEYEAALKSRQSSLPEEWLSIGSDLRAIAMLAKAEADFAEKENVIPSDTPVDIARILDRNNGSIKPLRRHIFAKWILYAGSAAACIALLATIGRDYILRQTDVASQPIENIARTVVNDSSVLITSFREKNIANVSQVGQKTITVSPQIPTFASNRKNIAMTSHNSLSSSPASDNNNIETSVSSDNSVLPAEHTVSTMENRAKASEEISVKTENSNITDYDINLLQAHLNGTGLFIDMTGDVGQMLARETEYDFNNSAETENNTAEVLDISGTYTDIFDEVKETLRIASDEMKSTGKEFNNMVKVINTVY